MVMVLHANTTVDWVSKTPSTLLLSKLVVTEVPERKRWDWSCYGCRRWSPLPRRWCLRQLGSWSSLKKKPCNSNTWTNKSIAWIQQKLRMLSFHSMDGLEPNFNKIMAEIFEHCILLVWINKSTTLHYILMTLRIFLSVPMRNVMVNSGRFCAPSGSL